MQVTIGTYVNVVNLFNVACPSTVLDLKSGNFLIHFWYMAEHYQEWIPCDSKRILNIVNSKENEVILPLRIGQIVKVKRRAQTKTGKVLHMHMEDAAFVNKISVLVQGKCEIVEFIPSVVQPKERLVVNRQSGDPSCGERLISTENPRYDTYRMALLKNQLHIVPMEGDGNCLFRSVSHQIYGTDEFHMLVRQKCMDYVLKERDFFEPFIEGDPKDFDQYVAMKRKCAVWGDDPEIQAMCELYDRPAIVYAYCHVKGATKLRTFHKQTQQHDPVMILSYYGGGHYDSIIGPQSQKFVILSTPGAVEDAKLQMPVQTKTMAQEESAVDVALQQSRDSFAQQNDNLQEVLKLSLEEHHEMNTKDATMASDLIATQNELLDSVKEKSESEQVERVLQASKCSADHADDLDAAIQASLNDYEIPLIVADAEKAAIQASLADFESQNESNEQAAIQASMLQDTSNRLFSSSSMEDFEIQRAIEESYQN